MLRTLPPNSLDSDRSTRSALIYCSYKNRSQNPQILRIRNSSGYCVISVAYPGRAVFFSAPIDAFLEIQNDFLITSGYVDYMACQKLQVKTPATMIHDNVCKPSYPRCCPRTIASEKLNTICG